MTANGPFRVDAHDNLVTAIGLAAQINPWNPAPIGVFGVSRDDRLALSDYRDEDDNLLEENDSQKWYFGPTTSDPW